MFNFNVSRVEGKNIVQERHFGYLHALFFCATILRLVKKSADQALPFTSTKGLFQGEVRGN